MKLHPITAVALAGCVAAAAPARDDYRDLDRNRDGHISFEEYRRAARGYFRLVDRNRDGFIDVDEYGVHRAADGSPVLRLGQAGGFTPPFPNHSIMHGAGKFGLASLANLDQLPPTGAVVVAAPLKIEGGSGSPVRVLAIVEE